VDLTLWDLDAGKRAAEAVNLHLLADPDANVGSWVAVRLSNGETDGVAYETWESAVSHQHDESWCCYLLITPDGITPRNAAVFIKINRQLPQPYPPGKMQAEWWDRYRKLKQRMN
jgi:hypothetical protein